MRDPAILNALALLAALVFYALLGGADFGGGVWDLLSRGPRGPAQRRLVAHAIGPVWETNHIWIVVAVVIMFTAFPAAFALVSTVLFVPLTLVLLGIVLRGAAFAFHAYHLDEERGSGRWGSVFAGASLSTPVLLGLVVGAVSSGRLGSGGGPAPLAAWVSPFTVSVGLLTLSLFAYLAAVYLTMETSDGDLAEDFRRRALGAAAAVALLAPWTAFLARYEAAGFYRGLTGGIWSLPVGIAALLLAVAAFAALSTRRFPLARACAAGQVALIVVGWGLGQGPWLIRPVLTVFAAAAPDSTQEAMSVALGAGALFLFPSIFVLFRVLKKEALGGRGRERP